MLIYYYLIRDFFSYYKKQRNYPKIHQLLLGGCLLFQFLFIFFFPLGLLPTGQNEHYSQKQYRIKPVRFGCQSFVAVHKLFIYDCVIKRPRKNPHPHGLIIFTNQTI